MNRITKNLFRLPAYRMIIIAAFALANIATAQTPTSTPTAPQKPADNKPATTATRPQDKKLPKADKLFENYVKALGGNKALTRYTSRVSKGTVLIVQQNVTGTVEVMQKAPDKALTVMTLTGFGEIRTGFDGVNAWVKDPLTGLRDMKGNELAAQQRAANFSQGNLRKSYTRVTTTGTMRVGERETYVVEAVLPNSQTPDKLYFDVQSGLLLRSDTLTESPQGKFQIETYYEDYRTIDGVKIPFTLRQSLGAITFLTTLTEIRHNVAVDESVFRKPAM